MTQEEHQEKDLIMTQEDKELLLKDLCARLPYNVQCEIGGLKFGPYTFGGGPHDVEDLMEGRVFKPYLRPMSSMTEEEEKEFDAICDNLLVNGTSTEIWNTVIDWLNEHYFDHRNLIEKGLALEAPEGMYKTE